MATNGFVYTRGYRNTASPDWVDALLQGSNDVRACCSWTAAGDLIVAYATAADVVIVNKDAALQVGYAARSGGFQRICRVGNYLYLVASGSGVFRLAIPSDCQTAYGDLTPASWSVWADNSITGRLPVDDAADIYGWVGGGATSKEYLAVVCPLTIYGGDRGYLTIVNITDDLHYDSHSFILQPAVLAGAGKRIYMSSGNLVNALYDAEAVSADNFHFDCSVCGTFADSFDDNVLCGWIPSTLWGEVVEQNQRLELSVETDADATQRETNCYRAGLVTGDFTLSMHLQIPSWPDLSVAADGRHSGARLVITFPHNGNIGFDLGRWHIKEGTAVRDYLRHSATGSAYVDHLWNDDDFWLRVERDGADIKLSYRAGGEGEYTPMYTYSNMPTGPGYLRFAVFSNHLPAGGWEQLAYVPELQTAYAADSAYNGMPNTDVRCLAVSAGTSSEGTSTVFAGFASGLWGCDTHEDPTGRDDEFAGTLRGPYDGPGGRSGVLPVSCIDALACTADAQLICGEAGIGNPGAGEVAVGTAEGLTIIDLTDDEAASGYRDFDEASGQPLVDEVVQCVTLAGSWVYGAANGGGWLEVDEVAPADMQLYLRVVENTNFCHLAWNKPNDEDFTHSKLFRRHLLNPSSGSWSSWEPLRESGLFSGGSENKAFSEEDYLNGVASFFDISIANDNAYQYRVVHTDEAGNESDGETQAAYIDEPIVGAVTLRDPETGNENVAGSRVIELNVSGCNSGADSGNAAEQLAYLKIYEGGMARSMVPFLKYETGMSHSFGLSDGSGVKTVYVRGYSQGLREGAATSCTILYDPNALSGVSCAAQKMALLHDFAGDGATLTADNGDTAFPPENAIDDRLGAKWQSLQSSSSSLTLDLGGTATIRYVLLCGHNIDDCPAGGRYYLGYAFEGGVYIETDITNLGANRVIALDMESINARYVRLRYSGVIPKTTQIGRMIVATNGGGGVIQPQSGNFNWGFGWGVRAHYSAFHATPTARYAANYRDARFVEIQCDLLAQADKRAFLRVYRNAGKHRPVVWLGKPEILPTFTDPHWATAEDGDDENNLVLYGFFGDDELRWNVQTNDLSSTSMVIEEAVE